MWYSGPVYNEKMIIFTSISPPDMYHIQECILKHNISGSVHTLGDVRSRSYNIHSILLIHLQKYALHLCAVFQGGEKIITVAGGMSKDGASCGKVPGE